MTKIIRTTILFCLYATCAFSQMEDGIYAHADSLLKAGKYAEAISYYDKLIAKNNSSELYYRGRGYAYLELGDSEKAEADYNKALDLNPNCSSCYSNLARIEANKGNLDKAMELLNLAIEKDEKNDLAFYRRGRLKEFKNDQLGALFDYNKAIKLKPDVAFYYAQRGSYYMNDGYNVLALSDMNKAVTLDSSEVLVVYSRAKYFIAIQDWNKALTDLNRCIHLQSANYEYYASKATVLEYLQRHDEAIENYNVSLQIDSSQYLTYLNRAITKYSIEDMDGSCADNSKALELIEKTEINKPTVDYLQQQLDELCNANNKSYYYQRGIAAYNLGQFGQAIKHYDEGLIHFPKSPMLLSFRGNAFKALGKDSLAIVDYTTFLRHKGEMVSETMNNPRFEEGGSLLEIYVMGSIATVYGSIAESYANMGSYDLAVSFADSAINLLLTHKDLPETKEILSYHYNSRGVIYNVQGNYEKAKSDFLSATQFNVSNPLPYANMAFALINERNALEYKTINMGFYTNSAYMGTRGVTMPIFKKRKIDNDHLLQALIECNTAIELDKKNAFAYLVRAQIKILLNRLDYCVDTLAAAELGILDAEEQLGVKCK